MRRCHDVVFLAAGELAVGRVDAGCAPKALTLQRLCKPLTGRRVVDVVVAARIWFNLIDPDEQQQSSMSRCTMTTAIKQITVCS